MSPIPSLLALFLAFAISASSLALKSRAGDSITANCLHDFAYTFDNGPYLWEDEIVDEFDCAAAKTTFFVKGNYQSCIYSEENVQRLRYAFEAGHQVASGGWSNADFSTLSNAQIDVEIQRFDEAIIKILGVKPKVFRANSLSDDAAAYITTKWGKTVVSSDKDSGDTNAGATSQGIYQFYQGLASEGQGHPHLARSDETQSIAVDALDLGTLLLFTAAGIRLVTVAQCLDTAPYDVVGNYGIRDDSWTCDGSWSPLTASGCAQTYIATASDKNCAAIAAKFGVTAQAVYFANPFLNCQDIWNFTPVCIPAAPTSTPQITCAQKYNTVAGETCTTIADNFGITPEQLFNANPFLTCNDIWSGTPLCIPASTTAVACSTTYHSVSGDTCTSVAVLYGLSSNAIKNSNSFLNCSDIWVNTPICIPPGGSGPTTSTTSSSTPAPSCVSTYYSADGDDCATIEGHFGLSSGAIKQANSFVTCTDIWVNTPICIPPGGSPPTSGSQCTRTIIISALGETCKSIAAGNGVSEAQIKTWNDFLDCNDIWFGTPVCVAH